CFLLPTSSPSEHSQVEHNGNIAHNPSSKEVSPTIFPGLNSIIELSLPHDSMCEPADTVSGDEKEH
ncbi:RBP1 protein, partial [Chaetorhynchus papuensis]|nr:RBP1 protein [Chaetorhynchus papuensis]